MNIETKIKNNVLYILLSGELDEYSASYTRDFLDNAFSKLNFEDVVLDMTNLDFMDSTGIGVLIGRYKFLKNKCKRIFISNANPTIEKIIKMSGIYEIMPKIS
ncbi:MAG: anti-sigma factor antagonist [Christensenellales bacterium]